MKLTGISTETLNSEQRRFLDHNEKLVTQKENFLILHECLRCLQRPFLVKGFR